MQNFKSNQEKTIKAMLKESATQQLPKFYQSDLELDFERIRSGVANRFVWILRECGTQLAPIGVGAQPAFITSYTKGSCWAKGHRFYIVDVLDCTVTQTTAENLDKLILTPPAIHAGTFEGVVERIHDVLSHGVDHRIWGLWEAPQSVQERTAEQWLTYFRQYKNEPMETFMLNGMKLLAKYREAAFGRKKNQAA